MGKISVSFPIQYNDLEDFEALSPNHPVWLLTGGLASKLVIKGDAMTNSNQVNEVLQIMNLSSPSGRTVQLSPAELENIVRYTRDLRKLTSEDDHDLRSAIDSFQQLAAKPLYKFTKMDLLQLTTLGTGNTSLGDKKSIKIIAKAANAPGGLVDLGEIICADMWNSNYDRFSFDDIHNPGTITVNEVRMNYLINLGNIMVREMAGEYRFVGLDAIDPTSGGNTYGSQVSINKWGFRVFDRRDVSYLQNIKTIAERCADDLKYALGRKSGFGKKYRLKSGGGSRMAEGFTNAIRNIESHLKSMYGNNLANAPVSIRNRAAEVGWI